MVKRYFKRVHTYTTPVVPLDSEVLAIVTSCVEGYDLSLVCECYGIKPDTLYRYLSGRLRSSVTGYTRHDNFFTSRPRPKRTSQSYNKPNFITLWRSYGL